MSKPNFMHKNSCKCPSTQVMKPCYVWLHYPTGPGKIHLYSNIQDAYKFAHDTTIDYVSMPPLIDVDGKLAVGYNPNHLYDNDQLVCDVDWHTYLCDILVDIEVLPSDKIWNVSAGADIQVQIGLGTGLPESEVQMYCQVSTPEIVNST
jgi:hypothetical protein